MIKKIEFSARNRARIIVELGAAEGKNPQAREFEVIQNFSGGFEKRVAQLGDMLEKVNPPDEHAEACSGCQADTLKKPYGCSLLN